MEQASDKVEPENELPSVLQEGRDSSFSLCQAKKKGRSKQDKLTDRSALLYVFIYVGKKVVVICRKNFLLSPFCPLLKICI